MANVTVTKPKVAVTMSLTNNRYPWIIICVFNDVHVGVFFLISMNILKISKQLVVISYLKKNKGDSVLYQSVHCDQLHRSSLHGACTTRLDLVMMHAEDVSSLTSVGTAGVTSWEMPFSTPAMSLYASAVSSISVLLTMARASPSKKTSLLLGLYMLQIQISAEHANVTEACLWEENSCTPHCVARICYTPARLDPHKLCFF